MKKKSLSISRLFYAVRVLCSGSNSIVFGKYTKSEGDNGDISEIRFAGKSEFAGKDKVTFKAKTTDGSLATGFCSIKDGKMKINYSYSASGQAVKDEKIWDFEMADMKTIKINGQELKK